MDISIQKNTKKYKIGHDIFGILIYKNLYSRQEEGQKTEPKKIRKKFFGFFCFVIFAVL